MGLDDFAGDGEAEADADVALGIERLGGSPRDFRRDALAGVGQFEADPRGTVGIDFGALEDADFRGVGTGLAGVEDDFGEGVAEAEMVAEHGEILAVGLVAELGRGRGQVALGILEGLGDQALQRDFVPPVKGVAGEEEHLVGETGDAFDAVAHRAAEGPNKFGVVAAFGEQLLVGRDGHDGIADLVGEAFGHALDEAEIGGFKLENLRALDLAEIFDEQERGVGGGGFLALEERDAELQHQVGIFRPPKAEHRGVGAGVKCFKHAAADERRKVGEFERAGLAVGRRKKQPGGGIGLEDGQVAADDDAAAGELREHVGHHLVIAQELVVQPTVADGQAHFFEEMEDEREFLAGEGFAGDAAIEHGDADHGFAVENGEGDLGAEEFKFLEDFAIDAGLVAAALEDAAVPVEVAADAGLEGQLEVIHQAGREADGAGGAQLAVVRRGADIGQRGRRAAEEDAGAVDAENLAQEQEEFLEERFGAEAVGEDAGEITQHLEGAHRGHGGARGTEFFDGARGGGGELLGGGLAPEPGQQGVQDFSADRFGEDVVDAEQDGVLFPFPFGVGAVHEDWQLGGEGADLFEGADGLDVGQLEVEDAGVDGALPEQRLDLPQFALGDDPEISRIQHRPDGGGGTGQLREDEEILHAVLASAR